MKLCFIYSLKVLDKYHDNLHIDISADHNKPRN